MQALTLGERAVRANPLASAKLIIGQPVPRRTSPARIDQAYAARGPPRRIEPSYGYQDPAQWAAFGQWMYSQGLLKHNPNAGGLPPFTNEYLPGEGI